MSIQEQVIEDMLKTRLTFEELDKMFIFLPKDINTMIYQFAKPSCNRCKDCCNICEFYCYYGCLREERDLCCSYELSTQIKKYSGEIVVDIIDNLVNSII